MFLSFTPLIKKNIAIVQQLADKIWYENYANMISDKQIKYMLNWMYSTNKIKQDLDKNHNWYILELDNTAFGYLHFYPVKEEMHLSKLYIEKAFQGKGLAKKSLDFLVKKTKNTNLNSINLNVNKTNVKAIRAYEKYGFVKSKSIVNDIGEGFVMDDFVYTYFI